MITDVLGGCVGTGGKEVQLLWLQVNARALGVVYCRALAILTPSVDLRKGTAAYQLGVPGVLTLAALRIRTVQRLFGTEGSKYHSITPATYVFGHGSEVG